MRRVLPIAVLFGALVLSGCWSTIAQDADDGWRRTSSGWERLARGGQEFNSTVSARGPREPASHIRWDVHPAVLTLAQTLAVLAAMAAFPRPNVVRLRWLQEDWRAFLRRSFRASVFGS